MEKINLENIKKTKKAFLIIAFVLAGLSLLCIALFVILHFVSKECFLQSLKELFYWCSMCLSTLCLCVLPIMSYYKSIEEKEEKTLLNESKTTTAVLNQIGELIHSEDFGLVNAVLKSFCSKTSTEEICKNFHKYDSNSLFVDDFEKTLNNQIAKNANSISNKNRFPETKWQFVFANCVLDNWFRTEDTNNKYKENHQKIDAVINKLIYIMNKLEIISYQFLDIRINKEVFVDEIYNVIDDLYSKSYYLLYKINVHKGFNRIDSMCRMIYLEKNAK